RQHLLYSGLQGYCIRFGRRIMLTMSHLLKILPGSGRLSKMSRARNLARPPAGSTAGLASGIEGGRRIPAGKPGGNDAVSPVPVLNGALHHHEASSCAVDLLPVALVNIFKHRHI